jgi:hypothetical protein
MEKELVKQHKLPIVANENGYYPLNVFFVIQDKKGNWAKGKTIIEAKQNLKKYAKTTKFSWLTIFLVTNNEVSIDEAMAEVSVSILNITYQSINTQIVDTYLI